MGLFGGDESGENGRAAKLAANAHGNSVTADRLTRTDAGMMQKDFLEQEPVLSYLAPDEQPHSFFYNDTKGITRDDSTVGGGNDASYRSLCVVTDQRLLFFTAGSQGEAVPLGAITDVEASAGRTKHRLTAHTADHEYTFYVNNSIHADEVTDSGEYIRRRSSELGGTERANAPVGFDGLSSPWNSHLDDGSTAGDALDADPQGAYVTEARYDKVKGILDPGEKVHFITRGSTVDVEGSSAGQSLFGDDRSRKSGTRGWVRAVMTDKRVAIKIPQMLGTDERSVPYSSITSVDLDTGLVNKRLTLQTPGQTYHIEAHDPGKEEVRRAIRFVRQQVETANEPDVVRQESSAASEPDPLDQIAKLKELNDAGAISDEEFETKKRDLLDSV